jgi:transposase
MRIGACAYRLSVIYSRYVMVPPAELLQTHVETLQTENTALRGEVQRLALQVQDLRQQLWGKKTERWIGAPAPSLFGEVVELLPPAPAMPLPSSAPKPPPARAHQTGPKPLNPALPRETIHLPNPPADARVDDLTGAPLMPLMPEVLEVLARHPTVWYVKQYRRTLWGNADKAKLVYTPWPASVLPRAHIDVTTLAHLVTQHYDAHQPFYRLERQYDRLGVALPRSTQVSLMAQVDTWVRPLVEALQGQVFATGYVQADATPIPLQDATRPGKTVEGTIWAYRGIGVAPPSVTQKPPWPEKPPDYVWYEYQATKSPDGPDAVLKAMQYQGVVQTDGASGLDTIGRPTGLTRLGCWVHARRYFVDAEKVKERDIAAYLGPIQALFRIDRRAAHFGLTPDQHLALRARYSVPLCDALLARARSALVTVMPNTKLYKALYYLVGQQEGLRRCLTTRGARLDNNLVENDIRPLKLGVRNWLQIGAPTAGPRLAHLQTIIANCRLAKIDPEAYLIDVLPRILDHRSDQLHELLPQAWAKRAATKTATATPLAAVAVAA